MLFIDLFYIVNKYKKYYKVERDKKRITKIINCCIKIMKNILNNLILY
jgi:hypothetical protein